MSPISALVINFLMAIQGIESNHGQNISHIKIVNPKSIHFGDKAIGEFGMMPNTIRLVSRIPSSVEMVRKSPLFGYKIASQYALKVLRRTNGCPLNASILWLMGPNYKIKSSDYKTNRYVKFVLEWEASRGLKLIDDPIIKTYCK